MKILTLLTVSTLIVSACGLSLADEAKVKGVEIVSDTAMAVVNKTEALLAGDLQCTMSTGKSKYRDDYIVNPLGQKMPRGTLKKYDDGVR